MSPDEKSSSAPGSIHSAKVSADGEEHQRQVRSSGHNLLRVGVHTPDSNGAASIGEEDSNDMVCEIDESPDDDDCVVEMPTRSQPSLVRSLRGSSALIDVEQATVAFNFLRAKGVVVRQGDDMMAHVATARRLMTADEAGNMQQREPSALLDVGGTSDDGNSGAGAGDDDMGVGGDDGDSDGDDEGADEGAAADDESDDHDVDHIPVSVNIKQKYLLQRAFLLADQTVKGLCRLQVE